MRSIRYCRSSARRGDGGPGSPDRAITLLVEIEKNGFDEFLLWSGSYNTEAAYVSTAGNILTQWGALIILMIVFAVIAIIALKFIDRDKR